MLDINTVEKFCAGCFTKHQAPVNPCPVCGYDEGLQEIPPHHLRPRTVLNGRYLLGGALGEGGFGITYIGWDLNLDVKVAVKEYYPTGHVTRENTVTSTIQPYTGTHGDYFLRGRERFVDEAKRMAKLRSLPGIVAVNDFFIENATAYISMEYVDGQTLKDYLDKMGGTLPAGHVFELMRPVMLSLAEVHKAGIIHRDISPDNIIVSGGGQMKLLDFGAARDFADSGNKSLSVMLKLGFAPEEQYRSKGEQGPWTDVYALAATIYKCISGVTPEESVERLHADGVKPPSLLGAAIDRSREASLMKGMAVLRKDRYQNVPEFYEALYGRQTVELPSLPMPAAPPAYAPGQIRAGAPSHDNRRRRLPAGGIIAAAAVSIGIFILFFGAFNGWFKINVIPNAGAVTQATDTPSPPPAQTAPESQPPDDSPGVGAVTQETDAPPAMTDQTAPEHKQAGNPAADVNPSSDGRALDSERTQPPTSEPSALSITGYSIPDDSHEKGKRFIVNGVVSSDYNITSVTAGVFDLYGNMVTGGAAYPNAKTYDISKTLDQAVLFRELDYGSYRYVITAADASGASIVLVDKPFIVMGEPSTLGISNYTVPGDTHVRGARFIVKGVISSNYNITSVTGGVYGQDGYMVTGNTEYPNTKSCDIGKTLDQDILFRELDYGYYVYIISATDASGASYVLLEKPFLVV